MEQKDDDLINKIASLSINQREAIINIITELTNTSVPSDKKSSQPKRKARAHTTARQISRGSADTRFLDASNNPLKIGDRVEILTTRLTGRKGDTATVIKFNHQSVTIELSSNGSRTNRAARNLKVISN